MSDCKEYTALPPDLLQWSPVEKSINHPSGQQDSCWEAGPHSSCISGQSRSRLARSDELWTVLLTPERAASGAKDTCKGENNELPVSRARTLVREF